MPSVFISHATADQAFVEGELLPLLHGAGVSTWYSRDSIRTADYWERTIVAGLQSCDWFLIVLTPRSAASEWVKDELAWAMENRQGRILPLHLELTALIQFHMRLPRIQTLDFTGDHHQAGCQLLATLGAGPLPPPLPVATAPAERPAYSPAPRAETPAAPEVGSRRPLRFQLAVRGLGCAAQVSLMAGILLMVIPGLMWVAGMSHFIQGGSGSAGGPLVFTPRPPPVADPPVTPPSPVADPTSTSPPSSSMPESWPSWASWLFWCGLALLVVGVAFLLMHDRVADDEGHDNADSGEAKTG